LILTGFEFFLEAFEMLEDRRVFFDRNAYWRNNKPFLLKINVPLSYIVTYG
jgi:hypothetical protein